MQFLGYDPQKDELYKTFDLYFEHPILTKIKNVGEYSMYLTEIHSLLGREHRYLIAFVNKDDYPLGHEQELSRLYWITLQTRTMTDHHRVRRHKYIPRRFPPLMKSIILSSRDENSSKYSCPDYRNLEVILLPRKGGEMEYSQRGTIVTALETYSTIICWKNDF